VIANPTSVDHRMHHIADLLHRASGIRLIALFGPEHGARADVQDMVGVGLATDSRTGVPVHSLYGSDVASLSPSPEQLSGLDCLIFDVQDVGSRYYTFATTMLYAMKAAANQGLRFVVLDRPNPIGGVRVEGPTLKPGFESFVGTHLLPIRHGMTVGELAGLYRHELKIDVALEVVQSKGWSRSMTWRETGIPWVAPSPNMPTVETALVYPGGCLIEGTNLSEGRGTTRPFELWGAPWLERAVLALEPNDARFAFDDSVLTRPCSFRPMFHKHAGRLCFGVQPHMVDASVFSSVRLYTAFIAWARASAPESFRWRTEAYEFVSDPIAIDLLFGSDRERLWIESGGFGRGEIDDLLAAWRGEEEEFLERREPFLLYGE
jgi:uncharacterized protein YbbC (DUF1343 family)